MICGVVARSDTVYKAVPDLARAADGTLVCVYRESLFHLYHPFSRLVLHRSRDGGRNWDSATTLHELAEYECDGGLNNPRLRALADGDLLLICDWHPPLVSEYSPDSEIWLWRSSDAGVYLGRPGAHLHPPPHLSVAVPARRRHPADGRRCLGRQHLVAQPSTARATAA